jgi:cobalt-zinc-cadmium efflux system outer membrane protein
LRQQLAAIAGRADVATRPISGSIDVALPELEREATLQALVERSPQIRAARAAIERARATTALARRQTYPDLFIRGGAAYNREHGEDTRRPIGWEGQIEAGISVPLFNRNQGGIAAAQAEEALAESELTRTELSLRAQAATEFATYLTALRSAESFRTDIMPRAEQAYSLYLARYREMAAAYPQVLVSQRTLFDMAREYLVHLETAWRSALRLQGLLAGEGLDAPSEGTVVQIGSTPTD